MPAPPAGMDAFRFESKHSTGAGGGPAHLDLELRGPGLLPLAVESKFGEVFRPHSASIDPAYFAHGVWKALPACEALAKGFCAGDGAFACLDVPQLLKHIGGLARSYGGGGFLLLYLYYEAAAGGAEAGRHREECRAFAQAVQGEVSFAAMTYQELFGRLKASRVGGER
jgi:hypothetical protein